MGICVGGGGGKGKPRKLEPPTQNVFDNLGREMRKSFGTKEGG